MGAGGADFPATTKSGSISLMPPRPAPKPKKPIQPYRSSYLALQAVLRAVRWVFRWAFRLTLLALVVSVLQVAVVRFVDPPITETMLDRMLASHERTGRWTGVDYRFRHLDELGENVGRAAVASEDARFWLHHGFDLEGICLAMRKNQRAGDEVAGGSTITQQVARNVFLWQERSWLRKGLETWYAILLELIVPKRRILELYLNVAETGPLRFGMEAGARYHFGKAASKLSVDEAGRLAALLPSPNRWSVDDAQVARRAAWARENPVSFPGDPGFDEAQRAWAARPLIPPECRRR